MSSQEFRLDNDASHVVSIDQRTPTKDLRSFAATSRLVVHFVKIFSDVNTA